MSDDYIRLIPAEPTYVPPSHLHQKALEHLERLLPKGEDFEVHTYDAVTFIDQGENLEAIVCPSCGTRMKLEHFVEDDPTRVWWDELWDRLDEHPAESVSMVIPCCGATVKAMDLTFDWPAGFARFELSVLNPNISENLSAAQLAGLESILGCQLRQVWAHY